MNENVYTCHWCSLVWEYKDIYDNEEMCCPKCGHIDREWLLEQAPCDLCINSAEEE